MYFAHFRFIFKMDRPKQARTQSRHGKERNLRTGAGKWVKKKSQRSESFRNGVAGSDLLISVSFSRWNLVNLEIFAQHDQKEKMTHGSGKQGEISVAPF